MITFNNIVERFQIFADNHFFIKSFSFGSPDDVDLSKFTDFPLMHLVYTGATYDAGTKTYNLEVYILDIPNDKKGKVTPQKEAISDSEQCAEDIIADIRNGGNIFLFAQDYEVVNATTTPLEEETKNVLSGILLDISVAIPYEWDACNAPIDGVEPGGTDVTYARRGILRMLTIDGATDVKSVRTINVTNGTLTDDGDGVVTLDTGGGVEALEDLSDVNIIGTPDQGDVISYNSGTSQWIRNGGLQLLLARFKASGTGAQMYDTLNDTTKGYVDILATSATMKVNVTGLTITETSPGVLSLSVASGASGLETGFEALIIQGMVTADTANLLFKNGTTTYWENATGKVALSSPNTGNITVLLPSSSGTLALTTEALPAGGTTGQALVKTSGTDYDVEWSDIAVDVQYHDRYQTESEALRAGATATVELYYSAQGDGDGLAQSASTDTPTAGYVINRKIYYSEAGFADPDTGTWVEFTPAPADDATFATVKAALLEHLKARTGGTVPISLKQTWEETAEAPAFTGLLNETYGSGAAAAYSTRRLNGNYTGACMTILRASDSTTTAIGFSSEDIDEAAITTFCTGTTCTVQTWHDQSQTGGTGVGNDATQSTAASQPTIYTGGAIVKESGKLALDFDGASDWMNSSGFGTGAERSVFNVLKGTADPASGYANYWIFMQTAPNTLGDFWQMYSTDYDASFIGNFLTNGLDISATVGLQNQSLTTLLKSTSASNLYKDGVSIGSGSGTQLLEDELSIGRFSSNYAPQLQQEFIIYTSDKSGTDQTSIESNVGDYFTQNTPLLDTYTGAAACYSLRLMRTAYTGSAIRVRRSSDSTEQDIGFNVFGELDTVSLLDFVGTGGTDNGYVKTWYDQSGNSNDATQTTTANQPQIVSSGAVIVKNGKPAIIDSGTGINSLGLTYSVVDGSWVFSVTQIDNAFTAFVEGDTASEYLLVGQDSILSSPNGGVSNVTTYVDGASTTLTYRDDVFDTFNNTQRLLSLTFDNDTWTALNIGYPGSPSVAMMTMQEFIIYETDQSANRTAIESNINTFYSIY